MNETHLSISEAERMIFAGEVSGLIGTYPIGPDTPEAFCDVSADADDYVVDLWRVSEHKTLLAFQSSALRSVGISEPAIAQFSDGFVDIVNSIQKNMGIQ